MPTQQLNLYGTTAASVSLGGPAIPRETQL
jgi:hypothetical protein